MVWATRATHVDGPTAPALAVARDLLPCAVPFPGAEAELRRPGGGCRSVRSRRIRKVSNQCWANEAIRSLNEMNGAEFKTCPRPWRSVCAWKGCARSTGQWALHKR